MGEILDRLAVEKFEEYKAYPQYFQIGTVNYCNARCIMCPHAEGNKDSVYMNDEIFGKIADDIIQHSQKVKSVAMYWFGEPLLDKKISDRVAILHSGGEEHTDFNEWRAAYD